MNNKSYGMYLTSIFMGIVVVSCSSCLWGSDIDTLYDAVQQIDKPIMVIDILSVTTFYRTNVNREIFEKHLESRGADYRYEIYDKCTIMEILKLLKEVEFVDFGDPHNLDLRYRMHIEQLDGKIYVGPFGDILIGQKAMRPKKSSQKWLKSVVGIILKDIVIESGK